MNDEDKQKLEKLLNSGDEQGCLNFFRGMPEKERRQYFPIVKSFWSRVRKTRFIEDPPGTFYGNPLIGVAIVAYFSVATGAEIIKAKRSGYPDVDQVMEILTDRRPEWVGDWVESILGESSYWLHWRLIRRLIGAGLVAKPTNPRYFLGMITAINSRHSPSTIADQLEGAPICWRRTCGSYSSTMVTPRIAWQTPNALKAVGSTRFCK